MCQKVVPHFLALSQHIKSDPGVGEILQPERLRLLLILGQLAYESSRYIYAEQYLEEAWKTAQVTADSNLELQVDILRYLAHTSPILNKYREAKQYAEKAIEIGNRFYKSTDWQLARVYNVLGSIVGPGDSAIKDSLQAYQKAVNICKNSTASSRDSELQLAYSYGGMGYRLQHKKHSKALYYLTQAIEIYPKHLHSIHPFIGSIYMYIGLLGLQTDDDTFVSVGVDYPASRKYMEQALSIFEAAYGQTSYNVAMSYQWLSRILYVSEQNEDWEVALQKSNVNIEIMTRVFGHTYPSLTTSYYWKGKILHKLNHDIEAQSVYQEGLKVSQYEHHHGKRVYWIHKIQKGLEEIAAKRQTSNQTEPPMNDKLS
jgi:tetratricopeptide (TPR) repeat protein